MNDIRMRQGEAADAEAISRLINIAFRPERFFIEEDRISPEKVLANLETGRFLLAEEEGKLIGCIYIELHGERGYFGLLAVLPERQHTGLGSRLISEAEEDCRAAGCRFMDLTIVNLRTELPAFYERLGYFESGTEPFAAAARAKMPCHLVRMTKRLN